MHAISQESFTAIRLGKAPSLPVYEQHEHRHRATSFASVSEWREKIAALSKRKILRDGITPWEECTGSKSTWIWLSSWICCAKPKARSWYHNDTLVIPVRSRTPWRTAPVSDNPKGSADYLIGLWLAVCLRLHVSLCRVVLFKVLVKMSKYELRERIHVYF